MNQNNIIKKSALSPTFLIVGGAGFIGSHIAEALLAKNARVVVVDNFSTGKDIYTNTLLENPKFVLFNCDINSDFPKEIVSVDYVIHIAGLETYLHDKEDLNLDSLLTNALGTHNILEFCKRSSARFLLGSIIDIYKGLISPLDLEHYFGATPEEEKKYSLYEAKRYAEALVWEYYKKHHIDVRIVRLPEVYGPRMNFDSSGSLGSFIKSAVENKDIVVYGEGTEKEYYLYVADAVSGILKVILSDSTKGKIYTLIGSTSHTVLETAYLVKSLANSEIKVEFKSKSKNTLVHKYRYPDISTLTSLSWEPKTDFKQGIIATMSWLGYDPNLNSFKPQKIIDDKNKEVNNSQKETVTIVSPSDKKEQTQNVKKKDFSIFKKKLVKKDKTSLKSRLTNSFKTKKENKVVVKKAKPQKNPSLSVEKVKSNMPKIATLFVVALMSLIIVFVAVPFVQSYAYAKKGISVKDDIEQNIYDFNLEQAQKNAEKSYDSFYKSQVSLGRTKWLFTLSLKKDLYNDLYNGLSAAQYISKSAYYLTKGMKSYELLWDSLNPNTATNLNIDTLNNSTLAFKSAKENINFALAELSSVSTPLVSSRVSQHNLLLKELENKIDLLVYLSEDIPNLLGVNGSKKYLILFQNSTEIRPTGGFIGSYATLELESGKIKDLVIDDIYNPDGQITLRGISIQPPEPIKTYLKEDVLHIRNANWNPDFPTSAETIKDLFFRVDGRQYDGVIAVDLKFLENVLKVTGPIYLTAYNEEITPENFYERAQYHSEFNYTEGSNQKRSFLTTLSGKLLETAFSLESHKLLGFLNVFQQSLQNKSVLVYVPNSVVSAYFSENGWDGSLKKVDTDYLYVVNANIGGTKANYYVEPSMNYSVDSKTRDGLLRSTLEVNYVHKGVDNVWPSGPYIDYVRVLVPKDSVLTGLYLSLNNLEPTNIFDQAVISSVGPYTSFEVPFVIDPQNELQLTFEYDLPQNLNIAMDKKSYTLFWQKQPGTADDSIKMNFNGPFGTDIVKTTPQMDIGTNTATYEGMLNMDKEFSIVLK